MTVLNVISSLARASKGERLHGMPASGSLGICAGSIADDFPQATLGLRLQAYPKCPNRLQQGHACCSFMLLRTCLMLGTAWDLYDTNRDGVLSLEETEALFNSDEICQATQLLTNTT